MDSLGASSYVERATSLRSEGRLEEAILAARKATSLDAQDANAWWQLALALRDKDGHEGAIPALKKVTELVPDFPGGWHELGRAFQVSKRLAEAIKAYEEALSVDPEYIPSLRMLAYALKFTDDEDAPARRLAMLRTVYQRDVLDAEDTFDLAYLLGEAKEHAEATRIYERYTAEHEGGAAYYNLALSYRNLDRDADALDALLVARNQGYADERLDTVLSAVQRKLTALRDRVFTTSEGELPAEEWFQHYVSPFTLLDVDPDDIAGNPKALQKAKQALLREIELEDGKLDWVPGLTIDKSSALARLAELDNPEAWAGHLAVFRNDALNRFLSKGQLEHFLIQDDVSGEDVTLPYLLDEPIRAFIGPKFALQYDRVLARAIENADLAAVECLMDGRRWTLPSHDESCFASAKRLTTRLCEPLVALGGSDKPVGLAEVRAVFKKGRLGELLALLPMEFYEAHSAVGTTLRGLSVSYYNREADAEGAKAILAMGRACAQKSPSLAHQFDEDEKTLDKFINQEKASEAHLSFRDKNIAITKTGVVYGDRRLNPKDIVGLRWGLVVTNNRPKTIRHTIAFEARRGPNMEVSWTVTDGFDKQRELWGQLVDATCNFILPDVMADFKARLENRELTRVGPLMVTKDGVELTAKGWIFDKQVLVEWHNLKSTLSNGSVVLQDIFTPKATAELPLEATYNAFLLHLMAQRKDD